MCGVMHTNAHLMNSCGFASSRLIHLRYTDRLKRSLEIAFDPLTGEPSMAWKRITFIVLVPLLFAACVPQQKYDDLLTAYRGQEQTLLATQSDLQTARTNEERLRAQMAAAAADLEALAVLLDLAAAESEPLLGPDPLEVLARLAHGVSDVEADLFGVNVEGSDELNVGDVVLAELHVHQARNGLGGVSVLVILDTLNK